MIDENKYKGAWRDLKRRRSAALLVFIPLWLLVAYEVLIGEPFLPLPQLVFFVWLLLAGLAINRYILFRCPRCSERFFIKFPRRSVLGRRCMHCGL